MITCVISFLTLRPSLRLIDQLDGIFFGISTLILKPTHCYMSRVVRNRFFAYAKTKTQISFAETAKLISAFVFATKIVQSLYFLYTKFQASSHLVWLYSPVYVGPGQKPRKTGFLTTRLI